MGDCLWSENRFMAWMYICYLAKLIKHFVNNTSASQGGTKFVIISMMQAICFLKKILLQNWLTLLKLNYEKWEIPLKASLVQNELFNLALNLAGTRSLEHNLTTSIGKWVKLFSNFITDSVTFRYTEALIQKLSSESIAVSYPGRLKEMYLISFHAPFSYVFDI